MSKLRCALYPRVSTEEQFLHGLSMDAQKNDLIEYANRHGYEIVGIYPDEGVSARKPVSKRPALHRLLEDVKRNKIDLILVTKLDRWFRNIKEYQVTEEILKAHNCFWKTIYEEYDTSTANGQMVVNIMLAVAQNECDRTSERIKVVLEHKKRNGEHVTGAAPYGYITENKKLKKDPERQHIVEDIFRFYFNCFSKRKTVDYIMDKYNDEKLTVYKINRILSVETYCGRYQGISGYYPAYITEEDYDRIRRTSAAKSYDHTGRVFLFSGLLKCPICGANLTGFVKKQKLKDGSRSLYKRYRCYKKFDKHSSVCITEIVVENYMLEHLWPELQSCIYKARHKSSSPHRSKVPQLQAEMDRLNIMFQKGRVSDEYYESQYTLLEEKIAHEKSLSADVTVADFEKIEKILSVNWIDMYSELDEEHKKAFWKRIIKEITFDAKTHKISGFTFMI